MNERPLLIFFGKNDSVVSFNVLTDKYIKMYNTKDIMFEELWNHLIFINCVCMTV